VRTDLFDFQLPDELIARHPPAHREDARLLSVRAGGVEDKTIRDLPELLPRGSLVVVNDTRVVPARLLGARSVTGGKVEIFLLARRPLKDAMDDGLEAQCFTALTKSSKPLKRGEVVAIDDALSVRILGRMEEGTFEVLVRAPADVGVAAAIERAGHVPLPPYMRREDEPEDRARYQTVFARVPGAVAAPTAGLHLTEELMAELRARGIGLATVTLHVGLGTFKPVTVADLDQHVMHEEALEVPQLTAAAIAETHARGAKVVAIGTTVVRALESSLDENGVVIARAGETSLLIQPGHRFRAVDVLLTNFHLPQSTLLALVSAFAGRSRVLSAYAHAIAERYRFFSYGDAMLLHDRVSPEGAAS
jgi:S-adenosylmethionine:tRNA ribosyltransferase-isomerase